MAGRELADRFERGPRRQRRPEREDVVETVRIELPRHVRVSEERLDLRSEQQPACGHRVEERTHADPIAREEQRTGSSVPDAERPLPIELAHGIGAFFFVEVQDRLGVGSRAKAMSFAGQVVAQFHIVEDLAVERDPQ